jgi:hypothetical protein
LTSLQASSQAVLNEDLAARFLTVGTGEYKY